jgi:hypothetical protein
MNRFRTAYGPNGTLFANPVYGVGADPADGGGSWDWLKPITSAVADIAKIAAQRIAYGEPDQVISTPYGGTMPVYNIGGKQYAWDGRQLLAMNAQGQFANAVASAGTPAWVWPALIGAGVLLVFLANRRR